MRSFRAKPIGWRGESYRHYLAAKGVSTVIPHEIARDALKSDAPRGRPGFKIGSTGFRYLPNSNKYVVAHSWTPERHAAFKAKQAERVAKMQTKAQSASQRMKEIHLGNPEWKPASRARYVNLPDVGDVFPEVSAVNPYMKSIPPPPDVTMPETEVKITPSQRMKEWHLGNPEWKPAQKVLPGPVRSFKELHLSNPELYSNRLNEIRYVRPAPDEEGLRRERLQRAWTPKRKVLHGAKVRVAAEARRGEHEEFAEQMLAKLKEEGLLDKRKFRKFKKRLDISEQERLRRGLRTKELWSDPMNREELRKRFAESWKEKKTVRRRYSKQEIEGIRNAIHAKIRYTTAPLKLNSGVHRVRALANDPEQFFARKEVNP